MKWVFRLMLLALVATSACAAFLHWAPQTALKLALDADRNQAGLVRKAIDMPGGEHLVYLEGGQGEPLVLIHGFGANKDAFTRVAGQLTQHHRVIIPDLIGFGESSRPDQADYRPAAQVLRLQAMLSALGVEGGVHLGGSSMGGQIAMVWAAMAPAQVKSLWLLDPAGIWRAPKSEVFLSYEATGKIPLIASTEDEFLALVSLTMSKPPFAPEALLRAMAHENLPHQALLHKIIRQIVADDVETRLQGLSTPTLLVWGDQDRVLSVKTVPVLQHLLPQAHVVVMKGIGHLPMMEDVHRTAADYVAFRQALVAGH